MAANGEPTVAKAISADDVTDDVTTPTVGNIDVGGGATDSVDLKKDHIGDVNDNIDDKICDVATPEDLKENTSDATASNKDDISDCPAAYGVTTSDDVTDCPVCGSPYRDARLMSCGHYFCLSCLRQVAAAHPEGLITCPTCRHVTTTDASDLQKYKVSEFQLKAEMFLSSTPEVPEKTCGCCDNTSEANMATRACWECKVAICDACDVSHRPLEGVAGHKTAPLSSYQFCAHHPHLFVLCVCHTCRTGVCHKCVPDHAQHDMRDVRADAMTTRDEISRMLTTDLPLDGDLTILHHVTGAHESVVNNQNQFQASVCDLRGQMKDIAAALDVIEEDASRKIRGEKKQMDLMQCDVQQFVQTKKSLMTSLVELRDATSDPDVALRFGELPKYANASCRNLVDPPTYETPVLSGLQAAGEALTSARSLLRVAYTRDQVLPLDSPRSAFHRLQFLRAFVDTTDNQLTYDIISMTCNPENGTLVVRSEDCLAEYNKEGGFVRPLGSEVEGIETVYPGSQGVCLDTTRGRYLVPTAQGELLLLDLEGTEVSRVSVCPDHVLSGVCCAGQYYFTSSIEPGSNVLYRIDGDSHQVAPLYTPFEMGYAMDMCGHVDATGRPLLAVCDFERDVLYVLDVLGNVKHAIHRLFLGPDDVIQPKDDELFIVEEDMEDDADEYIELLRSLVSDDKYGEDDESANIAADENIEKDEDKDIEEEDTEKEDTEEGDDDEYIYNTDDDVTDDDETDDDETDDDVMDGDVMDDGEIGEMYQWLRRPAACCTSPDGSFLVADRNRKRILAFHEGEDGEATFTPIISWLRAPPVSITCDVSDRLLFVSYDDGVIDVFEEDLTDCVSMSIE